MAKLLLLCGGAIIVAMLLGRLRRLLGVVVMLCAAAAAAAVFLLPIDGSTLWQRAQREGLPDDVASEAAGARSEERRVGKEGRDRGARYEGRREEVRQEEGVGTRSMDAVRNRTAAQ